MSQDGPSFMGTVGYEGIFVPKFTAEREPSILSYFGMMGEKNRHKLAELFPTPVSWGDYCKEVSNTSCTRPDQSAQRPPKDDNEAQQFFSEGNYRGFFHHTEQQDCNLYPHNCSGHSTPFPCGWDSFAESLFWHLDIALRGGGPLNNSGYPYGRQVEILLAANATQSNIIMEWWTPSLHSEILRGTPGELVKVSFPSPTQECKEHKSSLEDICSGDHEIRVGSPLAVCDEGPIALKKIIAGGLFHVTMETNEAIRSPAYQFLERFLVSELQLADIFQSISSSPNVTERDGVCQWVVDNYEKHLKKLIPYSHPRTLQETTQKGFSIACVVLGSIAAVLVAITSYFVYQKREYRVIQYAQIDFLWMLLLGSLTLSIGAVVIGVPPTDGTCVAEEWLVNVGYTLILVPLLIKVAAINHLMISSHKMRRVTIPRKSLLGATLGVSTLILVFLSFWTALDPPVKTPQYQLTESQTPTNDATIVLVSYYCSSSSAVWRFASAGWNTLLLFCSTIMAWQTRKVRQEFNESLVLTAMIYAGFAIVLLRVMSLFLSEAMSAESMAKFRSILYSVDVILTLTIYFVPKLLADTAVGRALQISEDTTASARRSTKNSSTVDDILKRSLQGMDTRALKVNGLEIGKRLDADAPHESEEEEFATDSMPDGIECNSAEQDRAVRFIVDHSLYPEDSRKVVTGLLTRLEKQNECIRMENQELKLQLMAKGTVQ